VSDDLVQVRGIVEKPAPEDAPSNLAVMGRYVFTPEIFDALEQVRPGVGGEIQLTDAIAGLLGSQTVYGWVFRDGRYDIGKKLDYLRATVELALEREDLGPDFRDFLVELLDKRGLR
jgi:UTP--glucose-1-phosphate uridylyltransferase